MIVFDELQEFPDIATALKFFQIDGRFGAICSGSMPGVYRGALYENIVAEAFAKSGHGLYYYKREDSALEEDFLCGQLRS